MLIVTDHKPLVKLLGDRTLDEITNARLLRLKHRTLPWRYTISQPGKDNEAADAMLRYPISVYAEVASLQLISPPDRAEQVLNVSIAHEAHKVAAISWKKISSETNRDPVLSKLCAQILNGFPDSIKLLDDCLKPFWNVRDSIYTGDDGVVLHGNRLVVPAILHKCVLLTLHSVHQGVSSMESRAHQIIYWPGMNADIQRTRDECLLCCKNATSHRALSTSEPDIPSTPFESIFADYFDVSNFHYLLTGDRLSGWVEVFSAPFASKHYGSNGLIAHLRSLFFTFGVPETLSSDGGPEFVASNTFHFLESWGVKHRISSAYFPQSNRRAEVAVKKVKRFLLSCIGPSGCLDNDKFLRGMLQLRNTPDKDCKVSPAQIIFGKPLRDTFSFVNRDIKFTNPAISPLWRGAWSAKERVGGLMGISKTRENYTDRIKKSRFRKIINCCSLYSYVILCTSVSG